MFIRHHFILQSIYSRSVECYRGVPESEPPRDQSPAPPNSPTSHHLPSYHSQ